MRSLTLKLTLAFLLVGLTGVILVTAFVSGLTRREFDQFVLDRVQRELVTEAVDYYRQAGTWEGLAAYLEQQELDQTGAADPGSMMRPPMLVFDSDGRLVAGSDGQGHIRGSGPGGLRLDTSRALAVKVNDQVVGYVQFAGVPRGAGFRLSPETAFLQRINRAIVLSALSAGLLALLLGAVLAGAISRPVRELTTATKRLAGGDLGHQVPVRTNDEIGELAQSFNQMSTDLARSNQARRQMTADIAHDLRTPLSVILGYSEALSDGKLPGTPETFQAMHLQAQHLNRLIDDLRTLSLADAGQLSLDRRPVAPRSLLEHTALAYLPQAEARGIALQVEGDEVPPVDVDLDRMVQVLGNLVANALRHTPDGGQVVLAASRQGDEAWLTVRDSGPGIPLEDLPHIFDRFYRGDKARTGDDGSSGLGLAIARSLVEAHGGRLSAENATGGGAVFTITLPLNQTQLPTVRRKPEEP